MGRCRRGGSFDGLGNGGLDCLFGLVIGGPRKGVSNVSETVRGEEEKEG